MKNIIEAKIKVTEQDYNLLGLYSHEEYVGRIMVLKELLNLCNLHEMKKKQDCNILRKFQEDAINEMFEDFEDNQY
jgi:hypothetical protein